MFRKVRTITVNYIPTEWGIKVDGDVITAWAKLVRSDKSSVYSFYGRDADCYEEFERDGFTICKEVKDFAEADKWLKEEVMIGE